MMLLAVLASCAVQDPMAAVLARQAARTAVIDRCAGAVCSVMSMDAPGGGSGVIIDPRGYVLTNFHVVGKPDKDYELPDPPAPPEAAKEKWRAAHPDDDEGAEADFVERWQRDWREENQPHGEFHYKNKKVGLPDGRLYEGVVLGIDPGSDLAVLRLLSDDEGKRWPYCSLGDSDELLVGETVFAMGNPFLLATDFTPTVTFGIVSGTHRYQEGQGNRMLVYPDCIQVDAPVNPGNSGGPLFNEAGEVVGINGRISIGDRGRVNVGVGFAIAANQIRNFLGDLIAGRHAEHGTLDMSAWFMTSRDGEQQRRGVFVQQLFKDSIVAQAGIGLGDELLVFNGTPVRSANQLATMVGVLPAGSWVTLRFRPKQDDGGFGEPREITVKMTPLDTGSSLDGIGDDARLASRRERRIAREQVLRGMLSGGVEAEGEIAVQWTRIGPDGKAWTVVCDGDRLRLELGDGSVLVRTGPSRGFAIDADGTRELTVAEHERLRRELCANPMLWRREDLAVRLGDALLLGGVHVFGRSAWRFEIPGDGECEAWLFDDGSVAGFAFRDPLRREHLQWHVRGTRLRVVVEEDEREPGWTAGERHTGAADPAWFRRNG